MQLTPEQQKAVATEGNQKIEAVAGSGKTSTLIAYTQARRNKRFLYLAFNRAVREHAEKKFAELGLSHVTVMTAHSLAFKAVTGQAKFRNIQLSTGVKITELVKTLNVDRQIKDYATACKLAQHVNQCLAYFCNSALLKFQDADYASTIFEPEALDFVTQHEDAIMHLTKRWMEKMYSGETPMTHDFYLKLFHYLNPTLPFDYILFDEGQDASPVMLDLFLKQAAIKVIVGDRHQQIYGWRFAVNALEQINLPTNNLTQSFRFGSNIAGVATKVLELKKMLGETQTIQIQGLVPHKSQKEQAVIARTNVKLLEEAMSLLDEKKAVFYFEGGFAGYTFASQNASIYDVLNLYLGKRNLVKNEMICQFQNFSDLQEYAKVTLDNELDMICQLVMTYKANLLDLLKQLKERQADQKHQADYIFSTVHKAKGMEYDVVTLTDDFITEAKIKAKLEPNGSAGNKKNDDLDIQASPAILNGLKEEINILYVAVTRAKSNLYLPDEIYQLVAAKKTSEPTKSKK